MNDKQDIQRDSFLLELGNTINKYRKISNLTVADLSKKSGVSVGVISDLINQRGRVPSIVNYVNIANALELPDDVFLGLLKKKDSFKSDGKVCKDEIKQLLIAYGLPRAIANSLMIQIDALIEHYEKHREFKNSSLIKKNASISTK